LPLLLSLSVGIWIEKPWGLPAGLWALSAVLIASELLALLGSHWWIASHEAWKKLLQRLPSPGDHASRLARARAAAAFPLMAGTLLIVVFGIAGELPHELAANASNWWSNAAKLCWSLGPALMFLGIRFFVSSAGGERLGNTVSGF
jgi:hypothetical protein